MEKPTSKNRKNALLFVFAKIQHTAHLIKLTKTIESFKGIHNIKIDAKKIEITKDQQISDAILIAKLKEMVEFEHITALAHHIWHIPSLSCQKCVEKIRDIMLEHHEITHVEIDLVNKMLHFAAPSQADLETIRSQLSQQGYAIAKTAETTASSATLNQPVKNRIHSQFHISNMTCTSCITRIEKALKHLDGIQAIRINLATEKAYLFHESKVSTRDIQKTIAQAGYHAQLMSLHQATNQTQLKWQLLIAGLFALPFLITMLIRLFNSTWHLPLLLQFILATFIQFAAGLRFYKNAWHALKAKTGNMDLLVAVGTTAAYGLSIWNAFWLHQQHVYFETSAFIITFVLFGKWLENRAKQQASSAIQALHALRPEFATLWENGTEKRVAIDEVKADQIVIIKAGEKIPVDSIIQQGQTHVDESFLTGESLPSLKEVGASVKAGTINGDGVLLVKTHVSYAHSMLAKIIESVEHAQTEKAPIEYLTDKVSAIFVPSILFIALITFIVWISLGAPVAHAILNAVCVLVIACPCALGLATPSAIIVGTGVAARQGILIKDALSLEIVHRVNWVAFDKTGTLTQGAPHLHQIISSTMPEEQVLAIATQLQQHSAHPLAKAIIQANQKYSNSAKQNKTLITTTTVPGRGIQGNIEHQTFAIGNRTWLAEQHIHIPENLQAQIQQLEQQSQTVSGLFTLAPTQQLIALLIFRDELKPSAQRAIHALQQQHIQTLLITGDNHHTALKIANALNINQVFAQTLPEQKSEIIKNLQSKKNVVAMVGDGINDAPALAVADVSIAMASGTDVAVNTANITLMRNDPLMVSDAIDIARKTYRKIKQNLFWAFAYNVFSIPLAALGLLNPMIASIAMALSSTSVLVNALLLTHWHSTTKKST